MGLSDSPARKTFNSIERTASTKAKAPHVNAKMSNQYSKPLNEEQDMVASLLDEALADLPEGLLPFVHGELAGEQILAGVVLASAAPEHDSAEALSRRAALAAALELLQIGLSIHRLLLTKGQPGAIDSFLLGGTILAGDYCFSRAAVLASLTNHPRVVGIFAELLKEVSQANLRRVIDGECVDSEEHRADERKALFQSGALAGLQLAGLGDEEQGIVARYASQLSRRMPGDGAPIPDANSEEDGVGELPQYQRERWRSIVSVIG